MAAVVNAGEALDERLGRLVEPGHEAAVAALGRERTEERALWLPVLGQGWAYGDAAAIVYPHHVDEVHRIAGDDAAHDTVSAGSDATPRRLARACGRQRRGCALASASTMWRTNTADTPGAWGSG